MTTAAVTPNLEQAIPMQFKDGSQAMVPQSKVNDAMYDGGELLHPMKFPDGSQAMVPHSKLGGAFKDGGQRLDTKPLPASTWQDYLGAAFGAATNIEPGAETGEKDLGQTVAQGATDISSGHPVKGVAKIAGAVSDAASPLGLAGALPETGAAVKGAAQVAADLPTPSLKTLLVIAKDTARDAEVAGGEITSAGAKQFRDVAYKGAAEARAAGQATKAAAYDAAAMAAKAYGKFSDATTWLDKTIPGAPIALKIWAAMHLAKEGYDWATGSDEQDARETLFGKR